VGRRYVLALDVDRVREIREMNKKGKKPAELKGIKYTQTEDEDLDFTDDVTGVVELPKEKKKRKKKGKKKRKKNKNRNNNQSGKKKN
jgi:hypothetical protein